MIVLQTIGGMAADGGGTSSCTLQLMDAIHRRDMQVKLLTVHHRNPDTPDLGEGSEWLVSLPCDYRTPFYYTKNAKEFLKNTDFELYHSNGLWMHLNHLTCSVARKKQKPYIITPHGMLYADALKRSRLKKLPLEWLFFKKDVKEATCIHVTCGEEMRQVRRYGYRGAIAIIGNPVTIPDFIDEITTSQSSGDYYIRTLGFLGRLHPIKQIERILQGTALLPEDKRQRIKIVLMGTGDAEYTQFLKDEVKRLGLDSQVEFKGFVSGRQKFEELAKLSALFVPSDMENFGMIVPEALLVNTPVMASLGTPWQALNENRCGWWVDASPESIAKVIEDVLEKSPVELKEMGARGNEYVRRNFAADIVADKMLQLYRWILDPQSEPRPEFVYQ